MIYVSRFCGVDDASTSAAIRDAIGRLDLALTEIGAANADQLVLIYRNRLPGAVKLEIGYPIAGCIASTLGSEIRVGQTPAGAMLSALTDAGFGSVLEVEEELRPAGSRRDSFFSWQLFDLSYVRPWQSHPADRLLIPFQNAPPTQN